MSSLKVYRKEFQELKEHGSQIGEEIIVVDSLGNARGNILGNFVRTGQSYSKLDYPLLANIYSNTFTQDKTSFYSLIASASNQYILDVKYGNGLYVAVPLKISTGTSPLGNIFFTTTNVYSTWSVANSESWAPQHYITNAFTYGNGLFVSVGYLLSDHTTFIRSTANLITLVSNTTYNSPNNVLAVTYGNGLYVAGGLNGFLKTSTDTITWNDLGSPITSNNEHVLRLTYANNKYIGITSSGNVIYSLDTLTWSSNKITTKKTLLKKLAYGNGTFIVAGKDFLARSNNLVDWVEIDRPSDMIDPRGIEYAHPYWYVANNIVLGASVYMSNDDGVSWKVQPQLGTYNFPTSARFYDIIHVPEANVVVLASIFILNSNAHLINANTFTVAARPEDVLGILKNPSTYKRYIRAK